MGYELSGWARTLEHPCLTPRTRQVLNAICLVAHDDHGEFWMRGKRLIEEHLPDMSYGGYRNCLSRLVRNGLLIKIEHGGGRTTSGRGTTSRYRVNSPVVRNPHPAQGVLPEITRAPRRPGPTPRARSQRRPELHVSAGDVYRRVDELLAVGITPEQMVAFLEAVAQIVTGSKNMSRHSEVARHDTGKHVTDHDRIPRNLRHKSLHVPVKKHVTVPRNLSQIMTDSPTNLSQIMTSLHIHEEKIHEEKEEAAAAANLSRSEHDPSDFFELLAGSLAKAGHGGILAAQFSDLEGLAATYEGLTGSPPDERTSDYIAGRVSESRGVRNVVGLARRIAQDVLRTGEGCVERVQAPDLRSRPPPEAVREAAPDWDLLHLAHVDQVSPAHQVWASVLEVLRSQVPRPAFETWLAVSAGWAYAGGRFVVVTSDSFVVEMLRNRMRPPIERVLRDLTGFELSIGYAVAPRGDEPCPRCQAQDTQAAAS